MVLFFLIGCSSSVTPVDDGLEKQIFHFGNGSEPQGIDPHIVTGVPEHHILISLCEGLTIPNPFDDENLPGAAESWTVSDDGKIYIFKLRKNGRWSNGDPVTAEDFVWSWQRILTASLVLNILICFIILEGAQEYHTGITNDFDEVLVLRLLITILLKLNLKHQPHFLQDF